LIERCEKCGKAFMDKSEVKRHKMYEHIVPVSPFEETEEKEESLPYQNLMLKRIEPDNINNLKELQKSRTTINTNDTPSNNSNYNKTSNNIGNRPIGFRPFRF
jgi:hypothetical protein